MRYVDYGMSETTRKLGNHKSARRVWLEGKHVAAAGFSHGVRYQAARLDGVLLLTLTPAGDHKVSGSGTRPVIDILTRHLPQVERVEVRFGANEIRISIHPFDRAALGRVERLNSRMAAGQPVRVGSLCHGAGVASDALLRGLQSAGTPAALEFAVELDPAYLEHSMATNPNWHAGTLAIRASIAEVPPGVLPYVELLEAGLPCVSASRSAVGKKLDFPEQELKTTDLAHACLNIIEAVQPAIVLIENVVEYSTTASAILLRVSLEKHGYIIHERVIQGVEFALEARTRWVLVAVTRGLTVNLDELVPTEARPATVAEILEPIGPRSDVWESTDAKDAKQIRDAAAGNSFTPRYITPAHTRVPVLRRGLVRRGQSDPMVAHPTNPQLARMFTPREHARAMGINPAMTAGLPKTTAHEVLGQSVCAPAFTALGSLLAQQVAPFTPGSN